MPIFRRSDLVRFWPHGDPAWLKAFLEQHETFGQRYGVNSMQRWRHFLAQISAETGGLVCDGKNGACEPGMRENMRYRPASLLAANSYRIRKAQRDIPKFQSMSLQEVAEALCADRELLAETVYGGRKDLGNTEPGDGGKYIGRGPLQTTGREAYKLISRLINVDCVNNPELLEQPLFGMEASFAEWRHLGCNELADGGNVDKVSRRVNGGDNGLAERRSWLRRAEAIWPDDEMPRVQKPREEATAADLTAMGSRSANTAETIRNGAAAVAAAGTVGTVVESAKDFTSQIDALKGVGDAVHSIVEFAKSHVLIALVLGALVVAYLASRGIALMVENYRTGRYEPSGR